MSVLFADLAGSTALGERLDPEDVRALQEELFAAADGEIRRYGGVTEKFVGDAIMAVFGIPHAHEDDAERAVRAALALRERFAELIERSRERYGELALRIGVNTGEVVAGREAAARGELMVSGDAVNVAARLQQRAGASEILVGARTHAATHRSVEYVSRGMAAAKGKGAPLEAWAVVTVDVDPGERPGGGGFAAPMVGRDDELAVLRALAARVERERAPQLVTVFGPAGVGKSRLLAEFVKSIPQARVLKGRCLPYGDGITYWPLAEALKTHAAILDTDSADVARDRLRDAISAVVPAEHDERVLEAVAWTIGLALPPDPLTSDEVRRRLHDAWSRLLAALGSERLTVLAVEDIHWASEPLLDLLEHLADTPQESALLVVCPSRPELLDARPTWAAGRANTTALTLSPLSRDEAGRLAEALLGSADVPAAASMAILERADGNPFFLEEILRMLIDRGALARRNGGWRATDVLDDIPLPDSVHGVIAARIDLLEPLARDALRRCSVIGRAFWPRAVDVEEDAIAALGRRGLVVEPPASTMAGMREFAFKHVLIRDVAYGGLPKTERRRLHAQVAGWLGAVAPDREAELAELAAYHLEEAIAYGEDDPAVAREAFRLLLTAGEAALARAAIEPAEQLLERALHRSSGPAERAAALVGAARVDVALERYEKSRASLQEAERLAAKADLPTVRADALGWLSRVCWYTARPREAFEAADRAIRAVEGLPESPQLAAALARRSQLEMLRGSGRAAADALEAISVAERTGNRFAEVNARINLFTANAASGIEPSREEMETALEAAIGVGAHDEAYRALVNFLWAANPWLTRSEQEGIARETLARLAAYPAPESYGRYVELTIARFAHLSTGRWAEVDATILRREEQISGIGSNRIVWLDLAGGMAFRRGDLATAAPLLEDLRARAIDSDEPQRVVPMAAVLVPHALATGDTARMREITARLLQLMARRGHAMFEMGALPVVRAVAHAGELELVRALDAVARETRQSPLAHAVALGHAGLIELAEGSPARAAELLAASCEELRGLECDFDAACLDLDLARAQEASGDEATARATRTRARAFLDARGCVNAY